MFNSKPSGDADQEDGENPERNQDVETEFFYDMQAENDEYYWYSSDAFSKKVMKMAAADENRATMYQIKPCLGKLST